MNFRKLFLLLAGVILSTASASWGKPVNKTPYRIPGKAENRKYLSELEKKYSGEKSPLCHSCRINITLEGDHSGKIDFIEEYFIPVNTKTPLRKDYSQTFVELILPDGSYKSYHSPRKVPGIARSLLYVKYTKKLPPCSTLDFLLSLPLALPCKARETKIHIYSVKFEKLFHSILPPPAGKGISIRKLGRSSYILGRIPEAGDGEKQTLLRMSFHENWNQFGARYFEKYCSIPVLPPKWRELSEKLRKMPDLTPEEKLQRLSRLLPPAISGGKEEKIRQTALLAESGKAAGLEVFPSLAADSPSPNLSIAGNIFQEIFLVLQQEGKEKIFTISGGKLTTIPEKFHNGTLLILRGDSSRFRKIPPLSRKKEN